MRQRMIGGLSLSVVGLGVYELGADPAWSGAHDALGAAIDGGINWIDTGEVYFAGMNERVFAAAMRGRADAVHLSTKVAPKPDGTVFAPDQVREACKNSLVRLEAERIDLYLLHWPDDVVPVEDTWAAMRGLVDDGLVRLVGLSNFNQALIERCLEVGAVDFVQDGLSLLDYLDHRDLFRWCEERDIAVVAYEPLAGGMLAGAIRSPDDFARLVDNYAEWDWWKRSFAPGRFERSEAVVDGMRPMAEQVGCTLAQLAVAWTLHQSGVTATLAGSGSPAHVRDNAEASDILLTDAQLAELDALLPLGPSFAPNAT